MAVHLGDLTDMHESQLKGLGAIVTARLNEALSEVRRRYTVEAAVNTQVVLGKGTNVALQLLMDHARDELIMRVRADVDMLLQPGAAANAAEVDKAAADLARAKADVAREEARTTELRWKARAEEAAKAKAVSEDYIHEQVEARHLKKQQELDRKMSRADKDIAAAQVAAHSRVKAEVGVVVLISRWLRSFTTLALDDAAKRTALLELD